MSFSNNVRNEIARLLPDRKCCRKAELSALLTMNGVIGGSHEPAILHASVENAATAKKIYILLKDFCQVHADVNSEIRRRFKKTRSYEVITILESGQWDSLREIINLDDNYNIKRRVKWPLVTRTCCKRAYLRGIFLSRGFINRPEGNYHLEIIFNDNKMALEVEKILQKLDLPARSIERKNNLVVYIKDSEKIVEFLKVVSASKAVLDFENARIIKSMRNVVNRQVNCETANLAKTIDASVRQIEIIEKLRERKMLDRLAPELKELALLRIEYPDYTLKELGEILYPSLSKSGVAYRMQKLEKLAEELLDNVF